MLTPDLHPSLGPTTPPLYSPSPIHSRSPPPVRPSRPPSPLPSPPTSLPAPPRPSRLLPHPLLNESPQHAYIRTPTGGLAPIASRRKLSRKQPRSSAPFSVPDTWMDGGGRSARAVFARVIRGYLEVEVSGEGLCRYPWPPLLSEVRSRRMSGLGQWCGHGGG